jgi:hypothetical protein
MRCALLLTQSSLVTAGNSFVPCQIKVLRLLAATVYDSVG